MERSDMDMLADFLNGWLEWETDASRDEEARLKVENEGKLNQQRRSIPVGFARDSEAWLFAVKLDLPLVELHERKPNKPVEPDLFSPPPVKITPRYELDDDWYNATPHDFGGEPVDHDEQDEHSWVIAYDGMRVVFCCPRSQACTMSREHWQDGCRLCAGC